MRSAEETLTMFKQVLEQRRAYVRQKLKEAKRTERKGPGRPNTGDIYGEALRGGMLSELTTIECVLKMIEKGDSDPLTWWVEPLPQAIVRQQCLVP